MNNNDLKTKSFKGVPVPALGFGTWTLRGKDCENAVADALEIGYRHIDTAENYGNEEGVGAGIIKSGVAREDIFLTTKIHHEDLHPRDVRKVAENSLRNLQTEYVDLLLIHWPNDQVPLKDTLGTMFELKDEGKVRHVGVSNFNRSFLREAISLGDIFCNQVEYHPFLDQKRILKLCRDNGLMLTAYSPIAKGKVDEDDTIGAIGEKYGKTPAQVTLRWHLQQENVVAIPRSSSHQHRKENFDIWDMKLTEEEMDRIYALRGDVRLIDPGWSPDWKS